MSLIGQISGPSALFLLPCLGWLTDRGSNHRRRKTAAMIFAAGLAISGMTCIVMANVLHLNCLIDNNARMGSAFNISSSPNASVFIGLWSTVRPASEFEVFSGAASGNGTYPQRRTGSIVSFEALDSAVEFLSGAPWSMMGASDEIRNSSKAEYKVSE